MQNLINGHFFAVLKEQRETGLLKVIGLNYTPSTDDDGNTILILNATAISEKTLGVVQIESVHLEVVYEGSDLDTFEEVRDFLSSNDDHSQDETDSTDEVEEVDEEDIDSSNELESDNEVVELIKVEDQSTEDEIAD